MSGMVLGGASLDGQQPKRLPDAAVPKSAARVIQPTSGTWSRGPGTYTLTVCEDGCTIVGAPGKLIDIVWEAWGAGGGGGSGSSMLTAGGGGGGGAYARISRPVKVVAGQTLTYSITVGAGGAGGTTQYSFAGAGNSGEASTIAFAAYGVFKAEGGKGASVPPLSGGGPGGAGGGGPGFPAGAGHPGGVGANPSTCNGGGGGVGGAGGGPAAGNNGGNGGHGGYRNQFVLGGHSCTEHGNGYARTAGGSGGVGRVTITW